MLIDNIPLKFKFSESRWNSEIILALKNMFKNYNFKSLISRLDQESKPKQSSLF